MFLKSILTILLSLIALFSPACSSSQVRVGFAGSQSGNRMGYTYTLFTGQEKKTLALEEDQTLDLILDASVESGSITVQLIDPEGQVSWERMFVTDEAGAVELALDEDGLYQINVIGQKAKGGFDLTWELH